MTNTRTIASTRTVRGYGDVMHQLLKDLQRVIDAYGDACEAKARKLEALKANADPAQMRSVLDAHEMSIEAVRWQIDHLLSAVENYMPRKYAKTAAGQYTVSDAAEIVLGPRAVSFDEFVAARAMLLAAFDVGYTVHAGANKAAHIIHVQHPPYKDDPDADADEIKYGGA